MTEKNNVYEEPDQLIDQGVDAIRRSAAPPLPPAVQAATVARMQAVAGQPRLIFLYERIKAMKPRSKLVAAASFAVAVGAAIALVAVMTTHPAIAFADVKAQLQKAKTIQMTMSLPMPGATVPVDMRVKMFIKEPGLMRMEIDGGAVTVIDIPAKKMLVLEPEKKEALLLDTGQFPVGGTALPPNMLENIRKCLDGSEKALGEKKIDGQSAEGFCVKKDDSEMEVWVEKASGKPVMLKITSLLAGTPLPSVILRDIVLDQEMPDELFSLKPPAGYTLKAQALDMSKPVEADLVNGLKFLAESRDGKFPDSLSPGPELGSQAERAVKGKSDAEQQAGMQTYVRLILFSNVEGKTNRFQYAGKGVKLGDAATPIAWWRQGDGMTYRVLFGDLSLKDLPPSKLPASATTSSAPCTMPAAGPGLVRVRIIDKTGNYMSVSMLRPEVVVRIEKNSTTQPAVMWNKTMMEFDGATTRLIAVADLVVRIDDPRGHIANLPVCGPLKIAVLDNDAGTLASVDNLSAGVTLTVKPKAGTDGKAGSELVVELRDAEGKTKDVTGSK